MHLSSATASCMGSDEWGNRSGLAGLTICTDKYSPHQYVWRMGTPRFLYAICIKTVKQKLVWM